MRIDQLVQPNSLASSSNVRPARCNSTICRRNSGVYRFWDLPMLDSFSLDHEVSPVARPRASLAAGRKCVPWERAQVLPKTPPVGAYGASLAKAPYSGPALVSV